ncbi:MAG: hypothetical protein ABIE84_01780 [bacterium]
MTGLLRTQTQALRASRRQAPTSVAETKMTILQFGQGVTLGSGKEHDVVIPQSLGNESLRLTLKEREQNGERQFFLEIIDNVFDRTENIHLTTTGSLCAFQSIELTSNRVLLIYFFSVVENSRPLPSFQPPFQIMDTDIAAILAHRARYLAENDSIIAGDLKRPLAERSPALRGIRHLAQTIKNSIRIKVRVYDEPGTASDMALAAHLFCVLISDPLVFVFAADLSNDLLLSVLLSVLLPHYLAQKMIQKLYPNHFEDFND